MQMDHHQQQQQYQMQQEQKMPPQSHPEIPIFVGILKVSIKSVKSLENAQSTNG